MEFCGCPVVLLLPTAAISLWQPTSVSNAGSIKLPCVSVASCFSFPSLFHFQLGFLAELSGSRRYLDDIQASSGASSNKPSSSKAVGNSGSHHDSKADFNEEGGINVEDILGPATEFSRSLNVLALSRGAGPLPSGAVAFQSAEEDLEDDAQSTRIDGDYSSPRVRDQTRAGVDVALLAAQVGAHLSEGLAPPGSKYPRKLTAKAKKSKGARRKASDVVDGRRSGTAGSRGEAEKAMQAVETDPSCDGSAADTGEYHWVNAMYGESCDDCRKWTEEARLQLGMGGQK